jgi:hypothetical protein
MVPSICIEGARLQDVLGRARLARVLAEFYSRNLAAEADQWPDANEHERLARGAQASAERDCANHRKACSCCGAL